MTEKLTPEILLTAYSHGLFPMAEAHDDPTLFWVDPEWRGILPIDNFHLSRSLAKTLRQDRFEITIDKDFTGVITGCAQSGPGRESTWINGLIQDLYNALFNQGYVHTIEARHEGQLVGGLYGLALGGAFFGESMFTQKTDASKVALCHLVARLKLGGFQLLDCQFITGHLAKFGAIEISRRDYRKKLVGALEAVGNFITTPLTGAEVIDLINR